MVDLHIGDNVKASVKMVDANGHETSVYDVAGGVMWTSTDPTKVAAVDDDADPKDARIDVLALTDAGPVRLSVTFDGDPSSEGVRAVTGESEDLNVVPGEATGAEIKLEFTVT